MMIVLTTIVLVIIPMMVLRKYWKEYFICIVKLCRTPSIMGCLVPAETLLGRWRLCLDLFGRVFCDDVGAEPGSIISEFGGFTVKESRFRREMERLRNSQQRDLSIEVMMSAFKTCFLVWGKRAILCVQQWTQQFISDDCEDNNQRIHFRLKEIETIFSSRPSNR